MFERPLFTCKWSRKGRLIKKLMAGDGKKWGNEEHSDK